MTPAEDEEAWRAKGIRQPYPHTPATARKGTARDRLRRELEG